MLEFSEGDGEDGLRKSRVLRFVLLLGWVLGILLPAYSFSRFSSTYRGVFDGVFRTNASHIIMHTFLYSVLGYLLASIFFLPSRPGKKTIPAVLAIVATVAVFQEGIQVIFALYHLVPMRYSISP